MPRFDFRCTSCSATFEATFPFGSTKKPACPACGSKATEKLIAPPGIVFKGSGWYKTDSRGKGTEEKQESKKETKKEPSAEKKSEKKDS